MIVDGDGCQLHRHELVISTMLGLRPLLMHRVFYPGVYGTERYAKVGWYMDFKTKVDCGDAEIGIMLGEGEKV